LPVLAIAAALGGPAAAQPADNVSQGKSIDLIIGYPTGGANDVYSRLAARHLGRHLPGNPSIVPKNMPGAGSVLAANHIFNIAPKDGTTLGLLVPTLPLEEKLAPQTVRYRSAEFNWIGRMAPAPNVTFIMSRAPVKTIADAFTQTAILGATGQGAANAVYPTVLNNVLGTKFKIVSGYPGNREMALAVEKGEVEGQCGVGWSAIMAQRPQWIRDQYITLLAQESIKGLPFLNAAGVPLTTSFAKSAEDRQVLELVYSQAIFGRPYVVGPGVPAERLAALQKAFTAALTDPALKEEAERAKLDLDYVSGPEVQALVAKAYATPPHIVERAKRALIYRP
jgi:tripartite-type tricarboxylate transporter receptor subunit TctC